MAQQSLKTYRFTGVLERFPKKGGWHFVRFPFSVLDEFDTRNTVRMAGKINGIAVERALLPHQEYGHFIVLGGELRRKTGARLGNEISVELHLHENPDEVRIPEEMAEAFEQEPEALKVFSQFTPAVQRSLMSYIETAKRVETRANRATLFTTRFLNGYYASYQKPDKKDSL